MKTTTDIIRLANTGVNLVVDASEKTITDLMRIINSVINSGGYMTLKHCDKEYNRFVEPMHKLF